MFEYDDSNEINEDTIVVTGFTARLVSEMEYQIYICFPAAQTIPWSLHSGEKC